jgi:hypothetical protein
LGVVAEQVLEEEGCVGGHEVARDVGY